MGLANESVSGVSGAGLEDAVNAANETYERGGNTGSRDVGCSTHGDMGSRMGKRMLYLFGRETLTAGKRGGPR
jgi:hypothetical protein